MPVLNHMDMVTNADLETLLAERESPQLSLFMPTERMGAETRQNPIRFKNLVAKAEARLGEMQLAASQQQALLAPLQQLQDDQLFWQQQSDSLAVYAAPDAFFTYRLPLEAEELVVVGHRFHIKPLLPMFSRNQHFFILALSLNQVRLFQATYYSMGELPLEEGVTSMAEALGLDDPERETQFHTQTNNRPSSGARDAIFHGHTPDEDRKGDILRFFRKVNHSVSEALADEHAPLVLAGVEYLHPLYRQANTYAHLAEKGIQGNPDEYSPKDLHARAWDIVKSSLDAAREEATNRYTALAAQDGQVSDDVKTVLPAAVYGRVDTLFVARGVQLWGEFDPQASVVHLHSDAKPHNEDLLDRAAAQTIMASGSVYVVEPDQVPGETPVAAILRY